ncbi:MAG: hypothetical protein A2Z21_04470 [Candidatus Fraserbacteria bacterium RBG_16_55_9]|uniref:DUF4397 domain-containing protein n=1 Tax=Fraserbacteria sp. (strain RBG_16_55_9) TaxID=1817864 RepID=A0A1F5UV66_FRAXR|nr:MAG: hypothetical protein A2Z21_04470 [Candidatus Fraserbacteria bacterium RBG_16_55_9]
MLFVVALGQVALAAEFSQMRIAHLSPDAPVVDVWVDGDLSWADVDFDIITGYLLLRAGEHRVQLSPAGNSEPIIDILITLEGQKAYTMATLGPWDRGDLTPSLFVDDLSPSLLAAKVRFLHASPDMPAVDVAIAGGGPVLYQNLAFGQATGYLSMVPGRYDLEFRQTGTDTVVLSISDFPLNRMTNCTVYTLGSMETRLIALPVADMPSRVSIFSIWVGALLWAAIVAWFISTLK